MRCESRSVLAKSHERGRESRFQLQLRTSSIGQSVIKYPAFTIDPDLWVSRATSCMYGVLYCLQIEPGNVMEDARLGLLFQWRRAGRGWSSRRKGLARDNHAGMLDANRNRRIKPHIFLKCLELAPSRVTNIGRFWRKRNWTKSCRIRRSRERVRLVYLRCEE